MRNRSFSLKAILWLELGLAAVSAAGPQVASAAGSIKTDGSVGSAQTLAGPNYLIPQSLGTLSGNNLFHSFSKFNVGTGESATFTTITPTLANVISRVTGGSASQINGLIQLLPASGAPNFYFINPAGVTFGAGSSVNVPAAFHVTTAQYLKFPDGNLYADPAQTSTFSAAAPIAFGFLGNSRASVIINNGTFLGPQNATFQIVAGDVVIDNATVLNQAGDVRIVAMGNVAGEVGMSGTIGAAAGTVTMSNGGPIISSILTFSVDSTPAGNVSISAGSIGITGPGSGVFSDAFSSAKAGNIDIRATQSMSISNGGSIESDSGGSGNGGAVSVSAGSLLIDGQSNPLTGISSNAFSTGNAGSVHVTVDGQASILNAGAISTSTNLNSSAGGVAVSAGSLLIDGQSNGGGISSSSFGPGNAGSVQVSVGGQASIINTGTIGSLAFGGGNGGSVALSAGSLLIDGRGSYAGIVNSPSLFFGLGTGTSGPVQVSVTGQATIINGGTINSNTYSSVDAGSVTVSAGSLLLDGQGSSATISSDSVAGTGNAGSVNVTVAGQASIVNNALISTSTFSSGKGASVTLSANSLQIDGRGAGAGITSTASSIGDAGFVNVAVTGQASIANGGFVSSDTFGSGKGGSVTLSAGSLLVDGALISSSSEGTRNAGSVQVNVAGQATIANGGGILSSTFGAGRAGAVTISSGSVNIDGIGSGVFAKAEAGSSGQTGDVNVAASNSISLSNGGQISIGNNATVPSPASIVPSSLSVVAPSITLTNASITAASTGNIAASDINIKFGNQLFLDPSFITTSSVSGNGGSITIQGPGTIFLNNSQILTSVSGLLNGNAGNINLAAGFLVMNGGFIQANTAAPLAAGGNISIGVNAIVPSGGVLNVGGNTPLIFNPAGFNVNAIQAAAPTGVSGIIEVSAPVLNASGSLVGLSSNVLSTAGFGRSPCSSSGGSSLAQTGRGGLPVSSSDLLRAERENSFSSGVSNDVGAPFSEQASSNRLLAACR